jgi:hypothetical protein
MSYVDVACACNCTAQADWTACPPTTALQPLSTVSLVGLHSVRPSLSKEERNQFLLQDLVIDIATVTDGFMVPSTQLLHVGFVIADPCQAALDKLQTGFPWSAAIGALVYGRAPSNYLSRARLWLYPGPQYQLVGCPYDPVQPRVVRQHAVWAAPVIKEVLILLLKSEIQSNPSGQVHRHELIPSGLPNTNIPVYH